MDSRSGTAKLASEGRELEPGLHPSEPFGDFDRGVAPRFRVAPDRLTCDLGNKSVASDPPKGQRVFFPDLPYAEQVLHNEEHLVLQSELVSSYQPGDELFAIPKHVCPTSALHKQAYVIESGQVVDMWDVTARDRFLTV